jgi:hypothetical protein
LPEDLLEIDKIVERRFLVCYREFEISALSCKPNASGSGFKGNYSI